MIFIWDMLFYLGCMQLFLCSRFYSNYWQDTPRVAKAEHTFFYFSAFTVVFWLVWGGYSVDAWRYLSRFDHNPFLFHEEQVFWITGYVLNKLVPDPWPIKILSASTAIVLSAAYFLYCRNLQDRELDLAFILLLLTPGFFLLTGNTVRQGLAGSVEILGAVLFLQRRYWLWLVVAAVGFFIHQFGMLVVVAILCARFLKKYLFYFWLVSYLISPFASLLFHLFGYDLEDVLRYGAYSEGLYHWEKVLVSCALSIFVFSSFRFQPAKSIDIRHIYLALIAISNSVVIYEVPFERIFLFSDLVAPLAVAQILAKSRWVRSRYQVLLVFAVLGSVLLWTNHSIIKSLGYI